ncbi:GMC oxidoreductase [Macrolepiota fuliginosa MF-IS2]|uniref:pyranose dehydrogenase (acceptor) n=1 Tax=Macrolepiota fuliginosa MF-IS2 TaxID=1400762 RepID=A0A9P6C702_9AGAR|nr:GMC oxidoreductase [Macrolepiota fuliginosa MF-IS2]
MWSFKIPLLALAPLASAFRLPYSRFTARDYVNGETLASAYDFVIAGGGTAGLSLASLLSANSNFTVLVIESGDIGPDQISTSLRCAFHDLPTHVYLDTPAYTYFKSLFHSSYDYAYDTVPQPSAGGRNVYWPRGKVLGGSSAINGMYLIRPNEIEVDAWHDMISSQPNADQWSWDSLFATMKDSEAFTPPTDAAVQTAGMQWNSASHGTSGTVHHTYPAYMVPLTRHWLPTLEAAGITLNPDAYGGKTTGGFFALSAINPSNWTRSYAKPAYIDPLPPRSNLHILVNTTVTRIVFNSSSSGLQATAVEFSTGRNSATQSVQVGKEVIVSGGSVNSPQILQLSGVGPSDVLAAAGIETQLDLPGVGTHLQDHISAGVWFKSNEDTQGNIYNSGSNISNTPEFLSFINSGTAYVNATTLFGVDGATTMLQTIRDNMTSFAGTTGTGSNNAQVIEGFKAIYNTTGEKFFSSEVGLVELLFSINVPGQVAVQAAIQHPFSQGRVYINTNSAFDPPLIDPQYFSHWADVVTMREGLKLARQIAQTPPLSTALGSEVTPGPSVVTDDDWDNWLKNNGGTEFHPTSTCAMLPMDQGGVVDNKMKVYGTLNVRVVDASIFPFSFAAHTTAPLYGVVQKAAEVIQNDYAPTTGGNNGTPDNNVNSPGGSTSQGNGANKASNVLVSVWVLGLVSLVLAILF